MKTTKKQIVDWSKRIYEGDLSVAGLKLMKDVGDVLKNLNFRSVISYLILRLDDPSNLVLLCNRCH